MLGPKPFCIIQAGKEKSRWLAEAVFEGCGGGRLHVGEIEAKDIPEGCTPVFIGLHPSFSATLFDLKRARRAFVTVDNGYFKPYKEGGYFRATTNAMQWIGTRRFSGVGRAASNFADGRARFEAHGLEVKPWRTDDAGHILVPTQTEAWMTMMRQHPSWLDAVVASLRTYTKREIVLRHKPLKGMPPQPSLEEHLAGAYAVIGFSSNVLLKAAMEGIPIATLGYAATSPLGVSTVPSLMLSPRRPEREPILHDLAANQWTIEEIKSGRMWADLQDRYEHEFLILS